MSVLFTKEGSTHYSYDRNLKEIARSNNIRGHFVCVSGNVLFTKDGNLYLSYDENLKEIARSNNIRGEIKNR